MSSTPIIGVPGSTFSAPSTSVAARRTSSTIAASLTIDG